MDCTVICRCSFLLCRESRIAHFLRTSLPPNINFVPGERNMATGNRVRRDAVCTAHLSCLRASFAQRQGRFLPLPLSLCPWPSHGVSRGLHLSFNPLPGTFNSQSPSLLHLTLSLLTLSTCRTRRTSAGCLPSRLLHRQRGPQMAEGPTSLNMRALQHLNPLECFRIPLLGQDRIWPPSCTIRSRNTSHCKPCSPTTKS